LATLVSTPLMTHASKSKESDKSNRSKATGFFSLELQNGKWRMLDPKGEPFYLRGINHYGNGAHMPWNLKTRYPSQYAWRKSVRDRHKNWGFTYLPTSVGPAISREKGDTEENNHEWTAEEFTSIDYPFTAFMEVPRRYMGSGEDYPDVFSSDFRDMVDKRCREFVEPLKDYPNLIGYHFDHNPPWHEKAPGYYQWIEDVVASPDGMNAWIGLMKRIYGNTDQYRKTYGVVIDSFEDIRKIKNPLKAYISVNKGHRDKRAFMMRICEEWYKVFAGTIRKYDSNHLLLGDRNTTHLFPIADYALYIMARYVDVLSINIMGPEDVLYEVMEHVTPHWTGPIHLADTGAGINSPTNKKSGYMCKDIQEFDQLYGGLMRAGLSHPQLIGFGWCGYYDSDGRSGIVDVQTDDPLDDQVNVMCKWNAWFQEEFKKQTPID